MFTGISFEFRSINQSICLNKSNKYLFQMNIIFLLFAYSGQKVAVLDLSVAQVSWQLNSP